MQYHQLGRVDIRQGKAVVSAHIGEKEILSKHTGRDWTIAPDAELQDIITAAIALLEFSEQRAA